MWAGEGIIQPQAGRGEPSEHQEGKDARDARSSKQWVRPTDHQPGFWRQQQRSPML